MTVKFTKPGEKVSLVKESASGQLSKITVGLGWQVTNKGVDKFDLDASMLCLDASGNVPNDDWFVFYNSDLCVKDKTSPQYKTIPSPDHSIVHTGDQLDGSDGQRDDEEIIVDLDNVSPEIETLLIAITIYDADNRRTREGKPQTFADVKDAFVRVVDDVSGDELVHFALADTGENVDSFVLAKLHRDNGAWMFETDGTPYASGLAGIAKDHGVNV